ncbi:MAG: hypothetical protein IT350_01470 [Deltaproteobacteria bacterium]|nr:hypothetical protein [Deltaproteobacteria bacterium]
MQSISVRSGTLALLVVLFAALLLAAPLTAQWSEPVSFDTNASKSMKLKIPEVALSESETADLLAGKPIPRLLEGEGGLKEGWMRLVVPFEPPTVWRVITNVEKFDLESEEFPSNGSITTKKRTFMPYTFDCAPCVEGGKFYMYQLLVMPFVDPRHFTLERHNNRQSFPWESTWNQVPGIKCQDKMNPAVEEFRKGAILTEKNTGTWHVAPLPKEWVKSREDLLKTDLIYYVDSNPGGNLAAILPVVNKATKVALPALADNVLFHCRRWEKFATQHHPDDVAKWKQELTDYRKAVGFTQ